MRISGQMRARASLTDSPRQLSLSLGPCLSNVAGIQCGAIRTVATREVVKLPGSTVLYRTKVTVMGIAFSAPN